MSNEDFQGLFKYKMIMPIVYILFWGCLILGPIFFDKTFQTICVIGMTYEAVKAVINLINICLANLKFKQLLNRKQSGAFDYLNKPTLNPIYHALIFPCYREEVELMRMTLSVFAKHQKAKSEYLVFLAMEDRQQGSSQKAELMIKEFKNQFRNITYTSHVLQNGEPKLKLSNMNWCARHMKETFEKLYIQKEDVIVTAMDSDSWGSQIYFQGVEDYIRNNLKDKDRVVLVPPQVFARNNQEVSAWTTTLDQMHSIVCMANLPSLFFSIPVSNYSLSYNLLQKIDFWDMSSDAIAEDSHICFKASFKTDADTYTKVIYAPFNCLSLQTNQGSYADFKSKFWQMKRHLLAVSEVAYLIKMNLKNPFRWIHLIMAVYFFETFIHCPLNICCNFGLLIRYMVLPYFGYSQGLLYSSITINILINWGPILTFISYFIFDNIKRKTNSELFKIENEPFRNFWRFIVFFPLCLIFIVAPAFHYAIFEAACKNNFEWEATNFKTVKSQQSTQVEQQEPLAICNMQTQ